MVDHKSVSVELLKSCRLFKPLSDTHSHFLPLLFIHQPLGVICYNFVALVHNSEIVLQLIQRSKQLYMQNNFTLHPVLTLSVNDKIVGKDHKSNDWV